MKGAKNVTDPGREQSGDCCGHKARREHKVDEALAESFPASDPPAYARPLPKNEPEKASCRCREKRQA